MHGYLQCCTQKSIVLTGDYFVVKRLKLVLFSRGEILLELKFCLSDNDDLLWYLKITIILPVNKIYLYLFFKLRFRKCGRWIIIRVCKILDFFIFLEK